MQFLDIAQITSSIPIIAFLLIIQSSLSALVSSYMISQKKKVIYSCLCAHGLGGGSTAITPVFSNSEGSLCSSLGRFVTTGGGSKTYKKCFRLKGLDPVNNNAATRGILIHAGRMVTYHKLLPYMPLSKTCEGCLTITKKGLFKLHELYRQEKNKQILVYSFISKQH